MARIDEVAKAAGVSISTVSYALSGKRPVSADTRRRIEDAVRDLGYRPNAGARMLAGNSTQLLAVTEPLHEYTHAPTHMAFVLAASVAARRVDYDVVLLTEEDASRGMRRVAGSGLVDAIIALDVAPDDERVPVSRELTTPTVFIGIPDDHEGLTCVDLDFRAAAGMAVDALADAGHRTIALIGHTAQAYDVSNFPPRVRDGFIERARERGVEGVFLPLQGGSAAEQVVRALDAALAAGATGLALHNGEETHDIVLAALAARGVSVPRDLSVVSIASTFDTARLSTPLTVIPLVPQASCDLAVDLVAAVVAGVGAAPAVHLIAPSLVERGSVTRPSAHLAA